MLVLLANTIHTNTTHPLYAFVLYYLLHISATHILTISRKINRGTQGEMLQKRQIKNVGVELSCEYSESLVADIR